MRLKASTPWTRVEAPGILQIDKNIYLTLFTICRRMGQSLSQLYVHLIFCTKDRKPFINKRVRPELLAYLVGILKERDCPSIQTNAMDDHVHSWFRLSKNIALSGVVEHLKKRSSRWMKNANGGHAQFSWQRGYAAFSVSSSVVPRVVKYIQNQEEHHQKKSIRMEVKELVKAYDVTEYDPKYFWS